MVDTSHCSSNLRHATAQMTSNLTYRLIRAKFTHAYNVLKGAGGGGKRYIWLQQQRWRSENCVHTPPDVPVYKSVDCTLSNIRFSDTHSFIKDKTEKISKKEHLAFVLTELSAELTPNSKRGIHKSLDFAR